MGGGSDHEAFVYREGLPAAAAGDGGAFGTYHSACDDPASLRIFDPGMREADAAARYTGLLVLRLADAMYRDIRLGDLANAALQRVRKRKRRRSCRMQRRSLRRRLHLMQMRMTQ